MSMDFVKIFGGSITKAQFYIFIFFVFSYFCGFLALFLSAVEMLTKKK